MVPIAAFLAGALLSLLLPALLLIALVVWYWAFSVRVPENTVARAPRSEPAAAHEGPGISQSLPPEPGA